MKLALFAFALITGLLIDTTAQALTGGDVYDKMDARQQNAFVWGAADMASYIHAKAGNRKKADCIIDWLVGDAHVREVMGVFENYKDKDAVALIDVLLQRHCK